MSEFNLISRIIELSESKVWEDAKEEWNLATVYEAESPETCLCGHYPILELCIISNIHNKKTTTVGNCCVKKFIGIRSDKLFDAIKKIRKEPRKSVNEEMLLYAYRQGWITQWEQKFYDDIIRKRVLSFKQEGIKYKINDKILLGWNKKEKKTTQNHVKFYDKAFEDNITDLL